MADESDSKPRRVLVVEDELYVQGMLEDFLSRYGYEVTVVPTAEQAFKSLEKESIDLVLLDKNLPDMSGVEVLSQLRFNNPELPVIFMTGYPSERSKLMVRHLGISAYFEKPVNLKVLASAIAEALGGKQAAAAEEEAASGGPKRDAEPTARRAVKIESLDDAAARLAASDEEQGQQQGANGHHSGPEVLIVCADPKMADVLSGTMSNEIETLCVASDTDPVYDYLQDHRAYVLAVDFTMPGGAALALSRWAAQKDPTMSLLALVAADTAASDTKRLAESLSIRYSVTLPVEDPSDLVGKLEILLKRSRTLRAFREAVT
jgi:DNA-binding response OmpR family regulator